MCRNLEHRLLIMHFIMRLLSALLCVGLAMFQGAAAQDQPALLVDAWVTLRPPRLGISMRMPPDWEQAPPGPQDSTVRFAIRPSRAANVPRVGAATCNVAVNEQPGTRNRAQASINAKVQSGPLDRETAGVLFETLSSPQVIESRLTRFGDLPSYFVIGRGFSEREGRSVTNTVATGIVLQPGRMVAVTCAVLTPREADADAVWLSWRPLLTGILGSFMPEG